MKEWVIVEENKLTRMFPMFQVPGKNSEYRPTRIQPYSVEMLCSSSEASTLLGLPF